MGHDKKNDHGILALYRGPDNANQMGANPFLLMRNEEANAGNQLSASERQQTVAVFSGQAPSLGYINQTLKSVQTAIQTNYVKEATSFMDEVKISQQTAIKDLLRVNTQLALQQIDSFLNGHLVNSLALTFPSTITPLIVLRTIVSIHKSDSYFWNNDLNNINCVNSKLKELKAVDQAFAKIAEDATESKTSLLKSWALVKERVIEQIVASEKEAALFENAFAYRMNRKLLKHYLESIQNQQNHPLYSDIQNLGLEEVEQRILQQTINIHFSKILPLLQYAINKGKDANLDVISVFLINLSHYQGLLNHIQQSENPEIRALVDQSSNTLILHLQKILFDFEDPDIDRVSVFPDQLGSFDRHSQRDKILVKKIGTEQYEAAFQLLEEINKESLEQKNRGIDNENLEELSYLKTLFHWVKQLLKPTMSEQQYLEIKRETEEFQKRLFYSVHFQDERMIKDFLEKHKNKEYKDQTVKKFMKRLNSIDQLGWTEVNENFKFTQFLIDSSLMQQNIIERKSEEEKTKTKEEAIKQKEAENKAITTKIYFKKMKTLDRDLKDAMECDEEAEDRIIKAAARTEWPEKVIESILERLQAERETIIKEQKVPKEIIDAALSMLASHCFDKRLKLKPSSTPKGLYDTNVSDLFSKRTMERCGDHILIHPKILSTLRVGIWSHFS